MNLCRFPGEKTCIYPLKILSISSKYQQGISGDSLWNTSPNLHSNSTWILVSLTTQVSPGIPLHRVSAIPDDSLRIPHDFARWVHACPWWKRFSVAPEELPRGPWYYGSGPMRLNDETWHCSTINQWGFDSGARPILIILSLMSRCNSNWGLQAEVYTKLSG